MSGSFGSFSIHLASDLQVHCSTYQDGQPPILSIWIDGISVSLSPKGREGASDLDVANALRLAEGVAAFVAELERLRSETAKAQDQKGEPACCS